MAQMDALEKLIEGLSRSGSYMLPETKAQLKQILTSWLTMVVITSLVVACLLSGGAAIALIAARVAVLGYSVLAVTDFLSAAANAVKAQTDPELDQAAAQLARAIVGGGVALIPAIAKGGVSVVDAARSASLRWGGPLVAEKRLDALSRRAQRDDPFARRRAEVAAYQYRVPPPAKAGEVIEIKISELHSRQNQVDLGGAFPIYNEAHLPTVYWVDWLPARKPFWALSDGNHRTASQYLSGHTTIRARVEVIPQQHAENSLFGIGGRQYLPFPQNEAWHAISERPLGKLESLVGRTHFAP